MTSNNQNLNIPKSPEMKIKELLESSEIEDRLSVLVNNEFISDVTFLVGPSKKKMYGHKTLLALGMI